MPSGKSIQARGIDPDVVLKPEGKEGEDSHADYAEVLLPGHLRRDEEIAGSNAGDVLEGDAPIAAALAELKKPLAPAAPNEDPSPKSRRARPRPAGRDPAEGRSMGGLHHPNHRTGVEEGMSVLLSVDLSRRRIRQKKNRN